LYTKCLLLAAVNIGFYSLLHVTVTPTAALLLQSIIFEGCSYKF